MTRVLLQATPWGSDEPEWLEFARPVEVVAARDVAEVLPLVERVEAATDEGLWAAGFFTYEAAPAFDGALKTRPGKPELPLAWFGLYEEARRYRTLDEVTGAPTAETIPAPFDWKPSIDETSYAEAIDAIRTAIGRGETYQANFTMRLRTAFDGDPWALFAHLLRTQPVRHAAYVDLGSQVLCSASPELFFQLAGDSIRCRPMKGTSRRGRDTAEDRQLSLALRDSPKERAENLMIVDMIRNDLGRIARPGSVLVPSLFDLERYDSLWQLTSTVEARTGAGLTEILTALFPCASITGAPKVSTMEILAGLEGSPRGIYTGAIGYAGPTRRAEFNVAIRTVHVDRSVGEAEYGTGGGIVWDSRAEREYAECGTKAAILHTQRPAFDLLETVLWTPDDGYVLFNRHLARLDDSAEYWDYAYSREAVLRELSELAGSLSRRPYRARLTLSRNGAFAATAEPLMPTRAPWAVALAAAPVDAEDRLLRHKTTARSLYQRAHEQAPGHDDVLLWNGAGELTESTIANVVLRIDGVLYTPPVAAGLLAGTLRAELLERGDLEERTIHKDELPVASEIWLINSLRGWIPVRRITGTDGRTIVLRTASQ